VDDDLGLTVAVDVADGGCRPVERAADRAVEGSGPARQFAAVGLEDVDFRTQGALADDHFLPRLPIQVVQRDGRQFQQCPGREVGELADRQPLPVTVPHLDAVVVPRVDLAAGQHDFRPAVAVDIADGERSAGLAVECGGEARHFGWSGRTADHSGQRTRNTRRIHGGDPVMERR